MLQYAHGPGNQFTMCDWLKVQGQRSHNCAAATMQLQPHSNLPQPAAAAHQAHLEGVVQPQPVPHLQAREQQVFACNLSIIVICLAAGSSGSACILDISSKTNAAVTGSEPGTWFGYFSCMYMCVFMIGLLLSFVRHAQRCSLSQQHVHLRKRWLGDSANTSHKVYSIALPHVWRCRLQHRGTGICVTGGWTQ
jgi:hypothetical protein